MILKLLMPMLINFARVTGGYEMRGIRDPAVLTRMGSRPDPCGMVLIIGSLVGFSPPPLCLGLLDFLWFDGLVPVDTEYEVVPACVHGAVFIKFGFPGRSTATGE
jgi:hypothetical protein